MQDVVGWINLHGRCHRWVALAFSCEGVRQLLLSSHRCLHNVSHLFSLRLRCLRFSCAVSLSAKQYVIIGRGPFQLGITKAISGLMAT